MSRLVVIGGGVSGLAAAVLAARSGHSVDLLERGEQVGGRACRHESAGFTFDTGPSWYLMPEVFDRFLQMCGTTAGEELDLVGLDPGYRVFGPTATGFDAVDVPAGRRRVRELFEALEPGSGPRLDAYLDSASHTYTLALAHFLRTAFDRPATLLTGDVLGALPQLGSLLTESMQDRIERTVEHRVLRQILGYPAVFLASFPAGTPAIYHLMSHLDLVEGVQYPRGGMYTLVEALTRLARSAGVRLHTGHEATTIVVDPPDRRGSARQQGEPARRRSHGPLPRGRAREVIARSAAGLRVFPADAVLAAADLHHVETRMLPRRWQSLPQRTWQRRDPGMGGLVVMAGVDRRLPALAHHNLFFTDAWERDFAQVFGARAGGPPVATGRGLSVPTNVYVSATSRTDPTTAPAGGENLFLLVPCPADPSLTAGSPEVERIVDAVLDQVGEWADIPDLRASILTRQVSAPGDHARQWHAWRGTILGPAHTLGQSIFLRGGPRARKVENLYYAGAFTAPGVGLPMCLISAENAIAALACDLDRPGPEDLLLRKHENGGHRAA
ncbi:phytoene desaturase family protein [Brevibacterium jeotgali]|uniref:Phytoene desaturase n=1 Tax=Brevibacterium jeotgali TaxID=1262550 RepID=A0A2H1L816_9MICO|nr:phytoene desaturase family protein [Brevibacterium jeotgali]TWC03378.1 phytoene desaturase [Brevibacterium jeotgali]SMY13041.1 phytoene desaturase [Brevibacterium jeotgali]